MLPSEWKENRSSDPDFTSQSHIYTALKRAGSDYGFYGGSLPVSRGRGPNERQASFRSRTALGHTRNNPSDYSSLLKHSRAIMNKEIKLSVSRSRRWSGREANSKSTDFASSVDNKPPTRWKHTKQQKFRQREPQSSEQQQQQPKNVEHSAELNYHQTICNILSNKGGQSSYGHVAKVMALPADFGKHEATLPGVSSPKNQLNSPTDSKTTLQKSTRKHLDIRLPSVYESYRGDLFTKQSKPAEEYIPEVHHRRGDLCNSSQPQQKLDFPPNLNFSNLCRVLSDDSFPPNQQDKEKIKALMRKQVHRAITGCYRRRRSRDENAKVVVVHLPNPNIDLGTIKEHKRIPRLLLR